jgi:predicted RNA-binding Zn-ribbon protein involved in translation (DUF1610 family)
MKKTSTEWDHTKVCSHCGCNLHTREEYAHGRCERCQEAYEDEMDAIYGCEW